MTVQQERLTGKLVEFSRSAYAFITREGHILKAAGWNKPDKRARGSIWDLSQALQVCGQHSVNIF